MHVYAWARSFRAPRGTRMQALSHTSLAPPGAYIIPENRIPEFHNLIETSEETLTFTETPLEHTPLRLDIDLSAHTDAPLAREEWRLLYTTAQVQAVYNAAAQAIRELVEPASTAEFGGNTDTDATCDIEVLTRMWMWLRLSVSLHSLVAYLCSHTHTHTHTHPLQTALLPKNLHTWRHTLRSRTGSISISSTATSLECLFL
jgi:hypothetical protein